jgi:hypothetical protein
MILTRNTLLLQTNPHSGSYSEGVVVQRPANGTSATILELTGDS